jgi:nitrate reductase delta subunit
MRNENRLLFKALSSLLRFPDDDLLGILPGIQAALQGLPVDPHRRRCEVFIDYLRKSSPLQLQEEFSRLFDFSPETTLNITYHRCGDRRERGMALAQLGGLYRDSGYEIVGRELPDYLPLVLEFLSVCPEEACLKIMKESMPQVQRLAQRLKTKHSPYAALIDAIFELFVQPDCPER